MKVSKNGIALIKHFEGFRADAYQDIVGIWTIGYGETKGVKPGDKVTEEEATIRLEKRLDEDFGPAVSRAVKATITQNQFDALVCFCYNVGIGNFLRSTLLKKVNSGDTTGAAGQFLVWNKAGGKVVAGLTKRREAEKRLFSTSDGAVFQI